MIFYSQVSAYKSAENNFKQIYIQKIYWSNGDFQQLFGCEYKTFKRQ